MIAAGTLLLAYAVDRGLGEPPARVHPVVWLGNCVRAARGFILRGSSSVQLLRGALLALLLPSLAALLAHEVTQLLGLVPWLSLVLGALLLKPLFAVRALGEAAMTMRDALLRDDLPAARAGLSSLCSRDASALSASQLAAATIESVAENASDSIVAPLFFFALFGLPGAAFYRAVNTLDAMVGYRGELEWAGKASARLDDLLNLVPARITALLFVLVAPLAGANVRQGTLVWRRDGALTESPNAGHPMATMAGLLGVRLDKPGHYTLGSELAAADTTHITRAWRIVSLAALAAALLSATLAAVLHG